MMTELFYHGRLQSPSLSNVCDKNTLISFIQNSVVLVMPFTFSFSKDVDLLLVLVLVKMLIYF